MFYYILSLNRRVTQTIFAINLSSDLISQGPQTINHYIPPLLPSLLSNVLDVTIFVFRPSNIGGCKVLYKSIQDIINLNVLILVIRDKTIIIIIIIIFAISAC